MDIIAQIGEKKLIPLVILEDEEKAVPLGEAIIKGGLNVAEVTFRTKAARYGIASLAKHYPDLLVGAGSIISIELVRIAISSGAKFIVTPGFNPKVVDYCLEKEIPIIPGISSPTLIEMALERKLSVVKFFPAEGLGGIPFLKAMAAPYSDIMFVPTGGININNLGEYLSYPRVHSCGASWLVDKSLINAGQFDRITKRIHDALKVVKS